MRKLMLVLALVVLAVLSGSVMAAETGTTTVTAQFVHTLSIEPPPAYTWNLTKTGDNQVDIRTVNVTSSDPWMLKVKGTNGGKLISTASEGSRETSVFALPVNIYLTGSTWGDLTGVDQEFKSGTTPSENVPVYLRQTVSPTDQAPATIMLTFTGSIA